MEVRNVAVVGRAGAGKTALVAALCGSAVPADAAPTTRLELSTTEHRGVRLHLLDTPGHPELSGALVAGLRAADAVLFVVPAVGGLDAVTAQVWDRCEGRPRAIALTQLDAPGADTDEAVALCQRLLDEQVLPLQLPMHDDDGVVAGLLELLDLTVVEAVGRRPADPEHRTLVAGLRDDLLETVLAEADDGALLDRYLDGDLTDDLGGDAAAVHEALHTAVRRGDFAPAVVVSAVSGVGVPQLLDLLVDALPSPADAPCPDVRHADGSPAEPLACNPAGPLAAEVVAVEVGAAEVGAAEVDAVEVGGDGPPAAELVGAGPPAAEVGGAVLVRVWSGALPGVPAGHVARTAGDGTRTAGDGTRTAVDAARSPVGAVLASDLVLSPWDLPEPQLPVAVDGDVGALVASDPTLRLTYDTGQQLLWCLGEHHAATRLAQAPAVTRLPLEVPTQVVDGVRHEPWVAVEVRVPSAVARAVAAGLAHHGARTEPPVADPQGDDDDDDDEVSLVRAALPWAALAGWVPALAAASSGTATVTRTPLGWERCPG